MAADTGNSQMIPEEVAAAKKYLQRWLSFFFERDGWRETIMELDLLVGGKTSVPVTDGKLTWEHAVLMAPKSKLPKTDMVPLADVLLAQVRSRAAQKRGGFAAQLRSLLLAIGEHIDGSRDDHALWGTGSFRFLPRLHARGETSRRRATSLEYRTEVFQLAKAVGSGVDANRLVTAQQAWQSPGTASSSGTPGSSAKKREPDPFGHASSPVESSDSDDPDAERDWKKRKTGSGGEKPKKERDRFEFPIMYAIRNTAIARMPPDGNLFLNLDGLRTFQGSKDQFLVWCPEVDLCVWCPIQARLL